MYSIFRNMRYISEVQFIHVAITIIFTLFWLFIIQSPVPAFSRFGYLMIFKMLFSYSFFSIAY